MVLFYNLAYLNAHSQSPRLAPGGFTIHAIITKSTI